MQNLRFLKIMLGLTFFCSTFIEANFCSWIRENMKKSHENFRNSISNNIDNNIDNIEKILALSYYASIIALMCSKKNSVYLLATGSFFSAFFADLTYYEMKIVYEITEKKYLYMDKKINVAGGISVFLFAAAMYNQFYK